MSPTTIVAYLALFFGFGFFFLFIHLLIGRLIRPASPNEEKLQVYECGEPAIGSSFVQFDLRFYVVALLFIIFDVEVAFFFPWAVVFGKATHLMDPNFAVVAAAAPGEPVQLTPHAAAIYRELGVPNPAAPMPDGSVEANAEALRADARLLARLSIFDILVFFAVLMVGFAYVWRRGDLDWVRAVSQERARATPRGPPSQPLEEPLLVG